jgi:hypothetical protein
LSVNVHTPTASEGSHVSIDDLMDERRSIVKFREYRAPRQHGERFVEPAFAEVPAVIAANRQVLAAHGDPFDSLRRRARTELIDSALQYTSAYRDVSWFEVGDWQERDIIMAGHQPALFHPGVWFKNFALSHLAGQTGSVAVNLVIDNDVASSSSVRIPTIDPTTRLARYQVVAYDTGGGGVPYEQTTIRDRAVFDHFDQAVLQAIRPLVADPCVTSLWGHAKNAIARCGVAGCALAQARHGLEGELGLQTLELPMGVVCRSAAFAEFVLSILTELPRFITCYNEAAGLYRKAHGIRSSAHPVPNLDVDDEWFEAPLWIYGNEAPQREPAWVKLSGDYLVISDRKQRELKVDIRFPKLAAEQLASLVSPNFKLRPRALLTTMYARLVLSDLFLHGIGGGKYDQLGDMIIRSFFAIEPPAFMVISATVQLPGMSGMAQDAGFGGRPNEVRQLKRSIRDSIYQPELFAKQHALSAELLNRKQVLLARVPPRGERRAWHHELVNVNKSLSAELTELRVSLQTELAKAGQRAFSKSLLASREHPFCIFPIDYLTETYRDLLKN